VSLFIFSICVHVCVSRVDSLSVTTLTPIHRKGAPVGALPSPFMGCLPRLLRGFVLVMISMPMLLLIRWLRDPSVAFFLACILAALFIFSTLHALWDRDHIFKFTIGPAVILTTSIVLKTFNIVSSEFFVYVMGFFGVILAFFCAIVGNFIGQPRYRAVSHFLTAVSFLSPTVFAVLACFVPSGGGSIYTWGLMSSTVSSGINVLFNKAPGDEQPFQDHFRNNPPRRTR